MVTSASPFDHPFLHRLLGDAEIAACLTVEADIAAMLRFEAALAEAEAAEGLIAADAATAIAVACQSFAPDLALLAAATARDGVVVPELVRQLRRAIGAPHDAALHKGATSQDVIDTSLVLRLREVLAILDRRLALLAEQLEQLAAAEGERIVMGRTRMQDALPIPLSHRIAAWREPLLAHRARLAALRPRLLALQLGGAVGTRDGMDEKGPAIAKRLAGLLQLAPADPVWHAMRDRIGELASLLSLIGGGLGKLGQDVTLMAQNPVGELRLASGGGSSAMAFKSNPVAAETLVALARFNATLLAGAHQALVHENERSGAAWTLEWMVLPQMIVATAASLRLAGHLVGDFVFPGAPS